MCCFNSTSWLHILIKLPAFIIFDCSPGTAQTIYYLTLWGNNNLIFFMSRCSPVIIAHLDALIWLNGIFWWLYQHGAIAAQFSSHLSDSISGAASWRRAERRLHESRRAKAEEKEAGWRFIQPPLPPHSTFPHPILFFSSRIGGCHDNIEHSFHGERLSPSHFDFIYWSDTVE